MNLLAKQKEILRLENQLMVARGRDCHGAWKGLVHTNIFKMDSQQGPTVEHRELCSILCGGLHGRGVWGRMDTCMYVCMAESLHCPPENITLFIGSGCICSVMSDSLQPPGL